MDEAQAAAALGQERVLPMRRALERAKTKLEHVLNGSSGSALIPVDWTAPASPDAKAVSLPSALHEATVGGARSKLSQKAAADDESQAELDMYDTLPVANLQMHHLSDQVVAATKILIPNSLSKHLSFAPTTTQNDGTIQCRPPDALFKWQFFVGSGPSLPNHFLFEFTALHQTLHLLGFSSKAEDTSFGTYLTSWDLFRFADASVPIASLDACSALPRELRASQDSSAVTAINSASRTYTLSRGTRSGGDGFQASHWRSTSRLTPPDAIGVMDPAGSDEVHENLGKKLYSRADVEALDLMGWNVDPNAVQFANAGDIELTAPTALAQLAQGAPIVFEWLSSGFQDVSVYIHSGTAVIDDNPVREFYRMAGNTVAVTLPGDHSLPPGEYVWYVVGATIPGYVNSPERRFTVTAGPVCDSIDFNNDAVFPDLQDVIDFGVVFAGGDCPVTTCNDLDFNNDGVFPDLADYIEFLNVFGGGDCGPSRSKPSSAPVASSSLHGHQAGRPFPRSVS